MNILGISCGHDANICIVRDGHILLHFEKERFTRRRHDSGPVDELIHTALEHLRWTIDDIDLVASSVPVWESHGRSGSILCGELYRSVFEHSTHDIDLLGRRLPAVFVPHHVGHMAYSYYLSGFDDADIIAVDAYGNFTATAIGVGEGRRVAAVRDLSPSNLGSLWCMVSRRLFGNMLDAGKTMGLAPYGEPRYLASLKARYLEWDGDFPIINEPWRDNARVPVLHELVDPIDPLRPEARDMAASVQELTNETMLAYATGAKRSSGKPNLCLSGGVALNGIANDLIVRAGLYEDVFIGPAPNDGGLSIGLALYALHHVRGEPLLRHPDHVFLSRQYGAEDLAGTLSRYSDKVEARRVDAARLVQEVAADLAAGRIVAWFSGRAESGPRALGHRSILCTPAVAEMKGVLNHRVKHREGFRPFAPSILDVARRDYFDLEEASPYMLRVMSVHGAHRSAIPAVVHVDGSSRPQTVGGDPSLTTYQSLIEEFRSQTGIPMLLNTSFNIRGEPIVESPADAVRSFVTGDIDRLVLEDWIVSKV